jgi:hypothetical protein
MSVVKMGIAFFCGSNPENDLSQISDCPLIGAFVELWQTSQDNLKLMGW